MNWTAEDLLKFEQAFAQGTAPLVAALNASTARLQILEQSIAAGQTPYLVPSSPAPQPQLSAQPTVAPPQPAQQQPVAPSVQTQSGGGAQTGVAEAVTAALDPLVRRLETAMAWMTTPQTPVQPQNVPSTVGAPVSYVAPNSAAPGVPGFGAPTALSAGTLSALSEYGPVDGMPNQITIEDIDAAIDELHSQFEAKKITTEERDHGLRNLANGKRDMLRQSIRVVNAA